MCQTKNKLIGILASALVLLFFQSARADSGNAIKIKKVSTHQSAAMDGIGTGSSGSYVHGEKKSEGSKSKSYPKNGHSYNSSHKKPEGNGGKTYSGRHGTESGHGNHPYSAKHKKYHYSKDGHKSRLAHSGHSAHSSKCFFSHLLNFRHQLQLSESQVEKIQKMRFEYRKTRVMLKAEKNVAKMEFDRLVHGKTVDEAAIRAAGEKIIAAKTKEVRAKIEAKIEVMKLLTDEQRNKVYTMHSSH